MSIKIPQLPYVVISTQITDNVHGEYKINIFLYICLHFSLLTFVPNVSYFLK